MARSHSRSLHWSSSGPSTASTSRVSSPAPSLARQPGGSADTTVSQGVKCAMTKIGMFQTKQGRMQHRSVQNMNLRRAD